MSLRFALTTIALVGILGLSLGLRAEEAKGLGMDHFQLAQAVVRALGRQADVPVDATPADNAIYLQGRGIAPLRAWIPGAEATREDLAVVTVLALGLAGEVEDLQNVDSYMAVLDERQISLDTVMAVLSNVAVQTAITDLVLYTPIAAFYETFLSPVEAR